LDDVRRLLLGETGEESVAGECGAMLVKPLLPGNRLSKLTLEALLLEGSERPRNRDGGPIEEALP
jgi:hypothetical protein